MDQPSIVCYTSVTCIHAVTHITTVTCVTCAMRIASIARIACHMRVGSGGSRPRTLSRGWLPGGGRTRNDSAAGEGCRGRGRRSPRSLSHSGSQPGWQPSAPAGAAARPCASGPFGVAAKATLRHRPVGRRARARRATAPGQGCRGYAASARQASQPDHAAPPARQCRTQRAQPRRAQRHADVTSTRCLRYETFAN